MDLPSGNQTWQAGKSCIILHQYCIAEKIVPVLADFAAIHVTRGNMESEFNPGVVKSETSREHLHTLW